MQLVDLHVKFLSHLVLLLVDKLLPVFLIREGRELCLKILDA